jgi:putative PIN family toxin of toxin-antitoxin system
MKVVADTSVLVSAVLWTGAPHQLLMAAEAGRIRLYTSPALLEELEGALSRPTFTLRLSARRTTVQILVAGYARLAHLVLPSPIPPVITEDPDDDEVLACALAAQATHIVSGDRHLLSLKSYQSVAIMTPRTFLVTCLATPRGAQL